MKKIRIIFYLLIAMCLSVTTYAEAEMGGYAHIEGINQIGLADAENQLKGEKATFVDVNFQEMRESIGYINGAVFVIDKNWLQTLPKDKNTTLIFYGLNRLSYEPGEAASQAVQAGYKNSYVMIDGVEGWITSGRPVVKERIQNWHTAQNLVEFTDGIHKDIVFGEVPACRNCHGTYNKEIDRSSIKLDNAADKMQINRNCVKCHDDLGSAFEGSVHSVNYKALLDGTLLFYNTPEPGKKAQPLCVDCHKTHTGTLKGVESPKKVSSESCMQCHKGKGSLYEASFHGKMNVLNTVGQTPTIASCADCHGGHNIFKSDDFRSALSLSNRIETCGKCHEGSTKSFVTYIAHADHKDRENHPVLYWVNIGMLTLVITVFIFFGIHTILWAVRLFLVKRANPEAWKIAMAAVKNDKKGLKRFSLLHRIQHLGLAISFMGLSLSGMPQKFYDAPWAHAVADFIGGPINSTVIHHWFALLLGLLFATHVIDVVTNLWTKRDAIRDKETGRLSGKLFIKAVFGPDSLIPNAQDFRDIKANFKWFLGKGPRPVFDRWAYWEKFDYLAEIWGTFVFGITGLILLFPVQSAAILPGSAVNVAIIFHTYEGLLAMAFIFSIHFFNSHFRLDKFPMDMVIFLGNVPVEEAHHERAKWVERLKVEGRLNDMVEDEKSGLRTFIAKFIGFTLMALGLVLLVLILAALILMI